MKFKTKTQLLEKILQELVLVTGTSVQVYTQPIVFNQIDSAFEHYFEKRFWPHLTETTIHTLDGAGGVTTDDVVVDKWTDIKWIRHEPYDRHCTIPREVDGETLSNQLTYYPLPFSHTQFQSRVIGFKPVTSTDTIAIRARRNPGEFNETDTVPMDAILLQHFVSSALLSTDGTNPAEQARQFALAEDRYEELTGSEAEDYVNFPRYRYETSFTVAE